MSLNFTIHATDGDHQRDFADFDAVIEHVGTNVANGMPSNDGVVYGLTGNNEAAQHALIKYQSMGNAKLYATKQMMLWMETGRIDMVNAMLEKHADEVDVNYPGLLPTAVNMKLEGVAVNLMNKGANPNADTVYSLVADMAEYGQYNAIETLIDIAEQPDYVKYSAITFGATFNDMTLVKSMLGKGADIYDDKAPNANSALYRAIEHAYLDIASVLADASPVVAEDRYSFGLACRMNHPEIATQMIAGGFDVQKHKQALVDESMKFDNSRGLTALQSYGVDYNDQAPAMAVLAISGAKVNVIEKMMNDGVSFEHIEQDAIERGLATSRNPEQFEALVNRIGLNTDDMQSKLPELKRF